MTTQTMIHILENRRKSSLKNPTESQLLAEVIKALKKLQEYEKKES